MLSSTMGRWEGELVGGGWGAPADSWAHEDENAGRIAALNIGLSIAWKYFNQPPFDDNEKEDDEDNELDHIDRKLGRIL